MAVGMRGAGTRAGKRAMGRVPATAVSTHAHMTMKPRLIAMATWWR